MSEFGGILGERSEGPEGENSSGLQRTALPGEWPKKDSRNLKENGGLSVYKERVNTMTMASDPAEFIPTRPTLLPISGRNPDTIEKVTGSLGSPVPGHCVCKCACGQSLCLACCR